jgi:hypothetical protein
LVQNRRPAAIVVYALTFRRVGRVCGGLLVAVYGVFLAFTFAGV